nr:hypothetical protein Iba_chr08dCG11990 [Ipomoea batatas]GME17267.1 hypothetical protein Iba_scaffold18430CG0010 [Ipomoea batatas]
MLKCAGLFATGQNRGENRLEEQSSESDRRAVGSCSSMESLTMEPYLFLFVLLFFIVSVFLLLFTSVSAFCLWRDQHYFFVRFGLHSLPELHRIHFPDHRHLIRVAETDLINMTSETDKQGLTIVTPNSFEDFGNTTFAMQIGLENHGDAAAAAASVLLFSSAASSVLLSSSAAALALLLQHAIIHENTFSLPK